MNLYPEGHRSESYRAYKEDPLCTQRACSLFIDLFLDYDKSCYQ